MGIGAAGAEAYEGGGGPDVISDPDFAIIGERKGREM
jgi:hypothetical protein